MSVVHLPSVVCFVKRYGKFLVLDLLDVEGILPAALQKFDQVQSNLLPSILNKEFFDKEK